MCATETTIGRMKIGDKLLFGAYGVSNDDPHPILWLKGTPNGDFITRDVVDFLPFDAMERENTENEQARFMGNARYSVCNLLQFLNSEDESWFAPMHQYDAPPSGRNRAASIDGSYPKSNYGVRPVCTISPETVVTLGDDGMCYIKPLAIKQNVRTDEELFAFLGLVQP